MLQSGKVCFFFLFFFLNMRISYKNTVRYRSLLSPMHKLYAKLHLLLFVRFHAIFFKQTLTVVTGKS